MRDCGLKLKAEMAQGHSEFTVPIENITLESILQNDQL